MPKSKRSHQKSLAPLKLASSRATTYEEAVQERDEPRMQKVSVSVDRGLLNLVDRYIQSRNNLTRSEIFDQALELWARHIQRQADIACYAAGHQSTEEKKAAADWTAIQTEAARYIW